MKYIKATEVPNGTQKTKRFHIESLPTNTRFSGEVIGIVKWYPGWRAFAFFPQPQTLFEPQCLRDLADFCEAETLKRREERKLEREVERA